MKKFFKLFLTVCSIVLMAVLVVGINVKADDFSSDYTYMKNKKVAVLLDNSGSMGINMDTTNNISTNRMDYALYSLGLLSSMLGSNDSLSVIPINDLSRNYSENSSHSFELDLKSTNRQQAIKTLLEELKFGTSTHYSGGTPLTTPAKLALEKLGAPSKVSSNLDDDDSNEYWFVILTDGQFQGCSGATDLNNNLESLLSNYKSVHSIYIAFGAPADVYDLRSENFAKSTSNTAYLASSGADLISVMQKVGNLITGKYELTSISDSYFIKNNELTVYLDKVGFSIKNVTMLLQGTDAKVSKVSLVNGTTTENVSDYYSCSFDQKYGYTNAATQGMCAVMKSADGKTFNASTGSKMVITFDKDISKASLSLLAEPTLAVEMTFEYLDSSGKWIKTDEAYISGNLTPGNKIRVNYEVLDYLTGKKITFNPFNYSNVSYNNAYYSIADNSSASEISLVEGTKEVGLEVAILPDGETDISKKYYSLFQTVSIKVSKDPSYFKVTGEVTDYSDGSKNYKDTTIKVEMTENQVTSQITKADFEANYQFKLYLTNPANTRVEIAKTQYSISDDGTIQYRFETPDYGEYSVNFVIMYSTNKDRRSLTLTAANYPSDFKLKYTTDGNLSLSELQLKSNTREMQFELTSYDKPFNLESSIITYQVNLIVNGQTKDITKYVVVNDNVLSFVPTEENLGDFKGIGEKTVSVTVTCPYAKPTLAVIEEAKLTIKETEYKVETITDDSATVNIFGLKKSEKTIKFKFTRDGIYLNAAEIKKEMSAGNIKVNIDQSGWAGILPGEVKQTIESIDGVDAIVCKVTGKSFGPFEYWGESLIFVESKNIDASYHKDSSEATIKFNEVNIMARITAWISFVITVLVIAYIVVYCLTFQKQMLPRGAMLAIEVKRSGKIDVTCKSININIKDVLKYHLKHFLWLFGQGDQKPKRYDFVTLRKATKKDNWKKAAIGKNYHSILDVHSDSSNPLVGSRVFKVSVPPIDNEAKLHYTEIFRHYVKAVKSASYLSPRIKPLTGIRLTGSEANDLFKLDPSGNGFTLMVRGNAKEHIKATNKLQVGQYCFVKYRSNGSVEKIQIFIPKN